MSLKNILKKIGLFRVIFRVLYRSGIKYKLRQPIINLLKISGMQVVNRKELQNRYPFYFQEGDEILSLKKNDGMNHERFREVEGLVFAKPFVVNIQKGEIAGKDATGFDCQGRVILETTLPQFTNDHLATSVSLRTILFKKLYPCTRRETVFSLVCLWDNNYHHWLIDCLTRLEGVMEYERKFGVKIKLLIRKNLRQYQIDSLRLLGYREEDCEEWNGQRMLANNLLVSSFRRSVQEENGFYRYVSTDACRWLGETIVNNLPEDVKKKTTPTHIYISRRNTLVRKVVNEQEVIHELGKLGFVDYILEDMSFAEQVHLFANAKMIVSPHGAGLTNIIFSKKLKLVELFGKTVPLASYYELCCGFGFEYNCLMGDSPPGDLRTLDADIVVDLDKLLDISKIV